MDLFGCGVVGGVLLGVIYVLRTGDRGLMVRNLGCADLPNRCFSLVSLWVFGVGGLGVGGTEVRMGVLFVEIGQGRIRCRMLYTNESFLEYAGLLTLVRARKSVIVAWIL